MTTGARTATWVQPEWLQRRRLRRNGFRAVQALQPIYSLLSVEEGSREGGGRSKRNNREKQVAVIAQVAHRPGVCKNCRFERTHTGALATTHIRRAPSATESQSGRRQAGNHLRQAPRCGTALRHAWRQHGVCRSGSHAAHHAAHHLAADRAIGGAK
jgi:hypothetical protein